MVQKLLIMERDTKDELQAAIIKNVLEADSYNRISAISILEQRHIGIRPAGGKYKPNYFEAWIILEVPENKDSRFDGEEMMGMTE